MITKVNKVIVYFLFVWIICSVKVYAQDTIFEDDFETGDFSKWDSDGLAQITDNGCFSGRYCAYFDFTLHYGPMYVFTEHFTRAYLSFYIKFSPTFLFGQPHQGGAHLVRFYQSITSQIFDAQMDSGWGYDAGPEYGIAFFTRDGVDSFYFPVDQPFTTDVWHHYELYFKFNDPGLSNGQLKFRLDDSILIDEQNVVLRDGENENVEFDVLAFTNYDHDDASEDPYYFIDDVLLMTDIPDSSTDDNNGKNSETVGEDGKGGDSESSNPGISGGCGSVESVRLHNSYFLFSTLLTIFFALFLKRVSFKND